MTYATPAPRLLIANGRHLEEVKEYLGHSSIRVTSDRYGHLFPKARAELADSLDRTFAESATARRRHGGDSVRFLQPRQGTQ